MVRSRERDRLRAVALKIENADREGEYYTGLASTVDKLNKNVEAARDITAVALDTGSSTVVAP